MYSSTQDEGTVPGIKSMHIIITIIIIAVLDLDSVLLKLRTTMNSNLWHQFGMELGVPVGFLETLREYPDDESMVELLDHWLRNHPRKPTWDEIEQVVRKIGKSIDEIPGT